MLTYGDGAESKMRQEGRRVAIIRCYFSMGYKDDILSAKSML